MKIIIIINKHVIHMKILKKNRRKWKVLNNIYSVTVWIQIISASTFFELRFSLFFFFFFGSAAIVDFVNCEQCIRALFTVPQITLFSHFFIKNRSHSTIYTFKNYFATVFSVSVFSFSKNKLNPNTPYVVISCFCFNELPWIINKKKKEWCPITRKFCF